MRNSLFTKEVKKLSYKREIINGNNDAWKKEIKCNKIIKQY